MYFTAYQEWVIAVHQSQCSQRCGANMECAQQVSTVNFQCKCKMGYGGDSCTGQFSQNHQIMTMLIVKNICFILNWVYFSECSMPSEHF